MVECHASDLIARVRFPLPAPLCVFVEPVIPIDIAEFEKNKVKKGRNVYGIIVLNSPKKNVIEKVRGDNRIRLFEYQIAYREIK